VSREQVEQLLPLVIRRTIVPGSALSAVTQVMADLYDPVAEAAGCLEMFFDPWRCPERFLPLLATWLDLPLPVTTGPSRLRALIAVATTLHQVRGSRRALLAFLEAATGLGGFEIDETVRDADGQVRPFVVAIRAPAAAGAHAAMIERLVDHERPAHVRCELSFIPTDDTSP
jgi:phage tail-like protein